MKWCDDFAETMMKKVLEKLKMELEERVFKQYFNAIFYHFLLIYTCAALYKDVSPYFFKN